jgi:hypothetical protein
MALYDIIRFARDDAADWAAKNPILGDAEPGYEKDTGRLKFGDGYTRWNDLEYFGAPVPAGDGASDEAVLAHINSLTPHPVYDDGPSLLLLYQNAKV